MKAKKFFRASRGLIGATRLYALPPAAFNIIIVPPPFINPVSAPAKRSYPTDDSVRPLKKLTKPVQLTILHIVLDHPGRYLWEIQSELRASLGVEISLSSLCKFLQESNFSRQKMQLVAVQRDEELRSKFVSDVSIYETHMLVFIDETGADRRDTLRKYGYSLRGKPPRSCQLLARGERVSAITIMSSIGILDVRIERQTVTGDTFLRFVQRNLLPLLMPFDGNNSHSIVIMDNASVHHVDGVVSMITEVGALVHFLPPYSPDFAPIEECFSKVKATMRGMEVEMQAIGDIETIALSAFACITAEDCQAWIESVRIYC